MKKFLQFIPIYALLIFNVTILDTNAQYKVEPVSINIDLNKITGSLDPIWAWWGYDEPNYTYMKDGKKLLTEISELSPVPVYVRAHSLLVTGEGTYGLKWGSTNAYTEDENGNPIYDWTIVDKIIDAYIERGMKPLAQIGFMPEALSVKPDPYKHNWKPGDNYNDIYTGWAYPPKDYEKWAELVYQWVKHSIDRYGKEEIESWYWQLWNEPNIGYWKGTVDEFIKLHDYTADAVKRALPKAKIGGPETTGPNWDKRVLVELDTEYSFLEVRDKSIRGDKPDVNAFAAIGEKNATIMIWNYHDVNDLEVKASPVTIKLKGIPAEKALMNHYRVDQTFSNSYTTWKNMGEPQRPTEEQYKILEESGQLDLYTSPKWINISDGNYLLEFELPRQGVSFIQLTY